MAVKLLDWVDPKYVTQFESMLIILLSIFGFLNNFFIIIFILTFKTMIM